MPLHRRLPKRGFSNARFRDKIISVNVSMLEKFFEAGATVDENSLRGVGLVQGPCDAVKLLAGGELTKAMTILVDFASATAVAKVTQAGGSITVLSKA